jgi:uncharacterized RDD family membrane protein YckC
MSQTCPKCQRLIDLPGPPILFCCFCGSSMTGELPPTTDGTVTLPPSGESAAVEVPERLGGYRLLRKLGEGGMGAVYEGEDEASGRRVAVKLIDAEASGAALERFRQEGRLASAIDHPRCVFVYAADEDQGRPYIVLELMPGKTLEDLVQQRGPLPVDEAVRHTLDLVDGLEQVHKLGVIHRDVKPSNSFLDEDGRVKVGDFGLARSLAPSAKLTRTGAFVGTPLFAAPEQILNQPLDSRADVYSACATLYYLLTGKAPHDKGDGDYLGVLARVVTDDPPPARSRRPDLPPAVEQLLARGLSRDREARWPDLDELRAALAGLGGGRASWKLLGLRFVAYIADYIVLYPVIFTIMMGTLNSRDPQWATGIPAPEKVWLSTAVYVLYFALLEWLAGRTVGKWLMGLRVRRRDGVAGPGPARAFVRALVWSLLPMAPALVLPYFLSATKREEAMLLGLGISLGPMAITALMFTTMRRGNGFRGLHEIVSGTCVVAEAERRAGSLLPVVRVEPAPLPPDARQRVGPYQLQGVVHAAGGEELLLGLDPALGRQVWVWLRPGGSGEVPEARRELLRTSRLRWLGSGRDGDRRWDAFLAPRGGPAGQVLAARPPLGWPEARPVLESLLAELRDGADDGTLPEALSLDQVWLSPDGSVQIVDLPFGPAGEPVPPAELVGRLAALALQGKPAIDGELPRVPLPGHARRWLGRLPTFGGNEGRIDRLDEALRDDRDRPAEVTRSLRAVHLGLLAGFLFFFGGCVFSLVLAGGMIPAMMTTTVLSEVDYDRDRLSAYAGGEVTLLLDPGRPPLAKVINAYRVEEAALAAGRLDRARGEAAAYAEARTASLWQPQRAFAGQISANARAQQASMPRLRFGNPAERGSVGVGVLSVFRDMPYLTWAAVGSMVAVVALACLSAFAFRGGVRCKLVGVEVVRLDGRPAGRLRCAWRAFVAWAPACLLLAYARYLEDAAWRTWHPGADLSFTNAVVPAMQLAAFVLLAFGLAASFAWPTRAPHDRLSGTCLVPA